MIIRLVWSGMYRKPSAAVLALLAEKNNWITYSNKIPKIQKSPTALRHVGNCFNNGRLNRSQLRRVFDPLGYSSRQCGQLQNQWPPHPRRSLPSSMWWEPVSHWPIDSIDIWSYGSSPCCGCSIAPVGHQIQPPRPCSSRWVDDICSSLLQKCCLIWAGLMGPRCFSHCQCWFQHPGCRCPTTATESARALQLIAGRWILPHTGQWPRNDGHGIGQLPSACATPQYPTSAP